WYKKSTASAWKKKIVPATSNKLNIKNLLCNTNYVWQIRTICDTTGTDFTSAFSTVQNFTTAACKEAENVMEHDIAGISLYPNPTTNSIFVEFQIGNNAVIKLMDLNGKVVEEFYYEGTLGDVIEIDVTNIPAGMYLVSIQMGMFHETQKVSIIR
ncbi:MAG: T9SS type A sorting domain-containing protein, partial [Chitinophagales bacterium]